MKGLNKRKIKRKFKRKHVAGFVPLEFKTNALLKHVEFPVAHPLVTFHTLTREIVEWLSGRQLRDQTGAGHRKFWK